MNANRRCVYCDTHNSIPFSCRKTVILIIAMMLYLIIQSCRLYLRITSLYDSLRRSNYGYEDKRNDEVRSSSSNVKEETERGKAKRNEKKRRVARVLIEIAPRGTNYLNSQLNAPSRRGRKKSRMRGFAPPAWLVSFARAGNEILFLLRPFN